MTRTLLSPTWRPSSDVRRPGPRARRARRVVVRDGGFGDRRVEVATVEVMHRPAEGSGHVGLPVEHRAELAGTRPGAPAWSGAGGTSVARGHGEAGGSASSPARSRRVRIRDERVPRRRDPTTRTTAAARRRPRSTGRARGTTRRRRARARSTGSWASTKTQIDGSARAGCDERDRVARPRCGATSTTARRRGTCSTIRSTCAAPRRRRARHRARARARTTEPRDDSSVASQRQPAGPTSGLATRTKVGARSTPRSIARRSARSG